MLKYTLIFMVAICFGPFSAISSDFEQFLDTLSFVESSHNDNAIGDNGRSIGRYQISKLYFIDAQSVDSTLNKYKWKDCVNVNVANRVVRAYMRKYEARAVGNRDWEALARLHNSGPNWRNKKHLTNKYWIKIKLAMKQHK